jgi:hypothetical protein
MLEEYGVPSDWGCIIAGIISSAALVRVDYLDEITKPVVAARHINLVHCILLRCASIHQEAVLSLMDVNIHHLSRGDRRPPALSEKE